MSERVDLLDIFREHGAPLATLSVTASREDCLRLREKLLEVRDANQGNAQGYMEVECTFYVDVHDIDRYLSGELNNLAEIYTFPEDVKTHQEE